MRSKAKSEMTTHSLDDNIIITLGAASRGDVSEESLIGSSNKAYSQLT